MLTLLHIENIAVIESADIRFAGQFNALTGETGAGKSIVVDAIGAVIGQRASRDLIRTGAERALVSAVFDRLPSLPWFAEHGIAPDENGELSITRELQPDGRNVCRVSGRPVTVAQLRALGGQLVNIHGQHDGQQLLDESFHLEYLDRFGALEGLRGAFQARFEAMRAIEREIDALTLDEAARARRVDGLTREIQELERADLKEGEEEVLTERRDLLRNAERLIAAVESAHAALSGDEDASGASDLLAEAGRALGKVSAYSAELAALAAQATELHYQLADLAELVRDARSGLDASPGELDEVEARLDVIYRLKRKYGNSVSEMLAFLDQCRTELDAIETADDTIVRLEKKLNEARNEAVQQGEILSKARQEAAGRLQARITHDLAELDMPKVRFAVWLTAKTGVLTMDTTGMDDVRFLMSANVGEDLKPIQKIASGGELARIMLAMKNVLAENDDVTTLIFDEVDTGVSGRAAGRVAEKLAAVARCKQVLCVTHLPQLAAMADTHFSVEKGERAGHTYTEVEELTPARRRQELARLTGGAHITDAMLQGAGELLAAAEAFKKSINKE